MRGVGVQEELTRALACGWREAKSTGSFGDTVKVEGVAAGEDDKTAIRVRSKGDGAVSTTSSIEQSGRSPVSVGLLDVSGQRS